MKIASMGLRPHYLLDVLIGAFAVLTLAVFWHLAGSIGNRKLRLWTRCGLMLAAGVVIAGVALAPIRISRHMPREITPWVRAAALLTSAWAIYSIPVLAVLRWTSSGSSTERRQMLRKVAGAAIALPGALASVAFLRRDDLQLREFDIVVPGLAADLHGLRLVQISDIHLGVFVSEDLLTRAVAMANETKAHIALVTGDLISTVGDPLDLCLQRLKSLRSDAGTFGCMGNHEIYALAEAYTAREGARHGIRFLRQESQVLRFGSSSMNLIGVDYQRRQNPYLVGADALIEPRMTNVLLSHNPDVFPVAASQGFDLTIGGHTHGGQVNFEILERNVNIARFFTPYIYGRYSRDGKSLFVTRGVGTVGAPARLGAPPEVALIRLCAS